MRLCSVLEKFSFKQFFEHRKSYRLLECFKLGGINIVDRANSPIVESISFSILGGAKQDDLKCFLYRYSS